ncbi:hypothetical protein QBC35DRAFT_504524 [Podospora australis]|uniref:Uncharacterized protein n=1 Tax=Podospora australis TaxID=1536484 RepID=A0AAN6WRL0_9PEZI|nr:hypothetical protein QBC35DRAFT_504524 [Podospora australis]
MYKKVRGQKQNTDSRDSLSDIQSSSDHRQSKFSVPQISPYITSTIATPYTTLKMRGLSVAANLTVLATLACTTAAQCTYDKQSAPFRLKISSDNERINGSVLVSSHAGPPFRNLLPDVWYKEEYPGNVISNGSTTFYYNTSSTTEDYYGCTGKLFWKQPGWDSILAFRESFVNNTFVTFLAPGEAGTGVEFDQDEKLHLKAFTDRSGGMQTESFYNFHICSTVFGSYRYPDSLAWVISGEPDGVNCRAVNVTREWV